MTNKLTLGPVLGLESGNFYTVVFVAQSTQRAEVVFAGQRIEAQMIGDIVSGTVWRAELQIIPGDVGRAIEYTVSCDGFPYSSQLDVPEWSFYVPGLTEKPKFAYASCNGFSDFKLMNTTENPYFLWDAMKNEHLAAPFSALLMGGDQVYADSIWSVVEPLKQWNSLGKKEKIKRQATVDMKKKIDRFYSELYVSRWSQQQVAEMLASVPSIMMWDDHDIFDGWGSYPDELMTCPVYKAIYASAKAHFELLQVRGKQNRSLIGSPDELKHYSMSITFGQYTILALDNRSERTLQEVMSPEHWADVATVLEACSQGDVLLMTAVPVVYRDFAAAEAYVDSTPWEEEVTDDLKDHWRAKEHQGERQKLIMRLLDNALIRDGKTVMLSGDVHVGCLGVIRDKRHDKTVNIHQVVSSGIVHPAPTYIQWLGILTITNDDTEYLDENKFITADILKPYGSNLYIRTRNFVTLLEGSDGKLWVNWINEGKDKPAYPLAAQ
jgi:hypothetical protein